MSKIIRGTYTATCDIRPFLLQESDLAGLGSGEVIDKVIRGTCPVPIRTFTLPPWSMTGGSATKPTRKHAGHAAVPGTDDAAVEALAAADTAEEPEAVPAHVVLMQQAQEEAERCLAEAQARKADIEAQAYAEGFNQGVEEARRTATAQLRPVLQGFQQATADLDHLRTTVLRQAENDVVTLAFYLARKIIQREALEHREVLTATLQRALERLADQEHVTVRVNPDDLAYAQSLHADLIKGTIALKTLTIQGDEAVGQGGCLLESTLGTVDARLEVQIEELEHRFWGQHQPVPEESAA